MVAIGIKHQHKLPSSMAEVMCSDGHTKKKDGENKSSGYTEQSDNDIQAKITYARSSKTYREAFRVG